MLNRKETRELLVADMALLLGLSNGRDVAMALQRYWEQRGSNGDTFASELRRITDLGSSELRRAEAAADQLLASVPASSFFSADSVAPEGAAVESMRAQHESSPSLMSSAPSTPLARMRHGRYRNFALAGDGGMGIVYWALDTELNRQVAFKIVRPDAGSGTRQLTPPGPVGIEPPVPGSPQSKTFDELRARFLQEAWIT